MSIQEQIDADLKEAMRAKDTTRLGVLRMLKSAMKYAAIERPGTGSGAMNDQDAMQVLRKQVKQRHDSIESFEKGGRPELAQKERDELAVLSSYLPQAMSEAELQETVRAAIAETGATSKAQMGAVMKVAQGKAAGRVDGKTLSQEVQRQLS